MRYRQVLDQSVRRKFTKVVAAMTRLIRTRKPCSTAATLLTRPYSPTPPSSPSTSPSRSLLSGNHPSIPPQFPLQPKSILQYLPPSILQPILTHLDRATLQILFKSPSLNISRAVHLVLMERLAQGNSAFRGFGEVDPMQVGMAVRLCHTIRVGSTSPASNGVAMKMKGDAYAVASADTEHSTRRGRASVTWDVFSGRLPNEIMIQILEDQPYSTLTGLLTCGSAQLQRVAEAILWKNRQTFLETCMVDGKRKTPGAPASALGGKRLGRGRYRSVSELEERYLDKRFVLVNDRMRIEASDDSEMGGMVKQEVRLGSFWRVIRVDIDN